MPRVARSARIRRRLVVRLSSATRAVSRAGCTRDLSPGGMCLELGAGLAPGTHVLGKVELPDGRRAEIHGIVAWAREVPRALASVVRGGVGLRLVWADAAWFEFLATTAR